MNRKLVYLDTDLGLGTPRAELDDAAALITLSQTKNVRLIGAGSTYGNVPIDDATTNLSRAVSMLSIDIKLGCGAAHPLEADMSWFSDWQRGYGKTLGWSGSAIVQDAADLIIECVRTNPHQVTLLELGPLTNLALAMIKAPDIIPLVKEVIIMGGSFAVQNSTPEFNLRCDPEAAAMVLAAKWPVVMLGLNMTRQVHFARDEFFALAEWNPYISLLKDQAPAWIRRVESMGWEKGGCSLHDAVAAAFVIDPSLFSVSAADVQIELSDHATRGLTRFSKVAEVKSNKMVVTSLNAPLVHQLVHSSLNHQEIK